MAARGVLILAGDGPRTRAMIAECERAGLRCEIIRYADYLADPDHLSSRLRHFDALRVDSPDRDFASLAALYQLGREEAEGDGYKTVRGHADDLCNPGEIGSPAQLFYGLRKATALAEQLADEQGVPVSHRSADIARAHDKLATHAHLAKAGIVMAECLGPVSSFDALMAMLRKAKVSRVFLKLRHGSAAAGMIALAVRSNGEMRATTTAILTPDGLRSTRKLQQLTSKTEISKLVDALSPLGLFAERWLVRASVEEGFCDLRIVSVGDALFPVLRASCHPMTNLHLGGTRLPVDSLCERMTDTAWASILDTARETARVFPDAMSLGLDIAVDATFQRHTVLEVNAFGDFVHGLEHKGGTPALALLDRLVSYVEAAA